MTITELSEHGLPVELRRNIDAFIAYLKRRGRAENTLVKYRQVLTEFGWWLTTHDLGLLVRSADIEFGYLQDWYETFIDARGREPSQHSQRNRISALSSFYSFLDKKELLVDAERRPVRNPMVGIDPVIVSRKPVRWLKTVDDRALLETEMNDQERIIITFLRWTGARVNEATGVRLANVDLTPTEESIWIDDSKTPSGHRGIPLFPELGPELDRWLECLKRSGLTCGPQTPVLSTWKGTPMTNGYVWRVVKRVAVRAGVQLREAADGTPTSAVSPHTLRATFGSHLLNLGVRLEVVSELLGHADSRVTKEAYAEFLKETVRREALTALLGDRRGRRGHLRLSR